MVDILKSNLKAVANYEPMGQLAIARGQRLQATYGQLSATIKYMEQLLKQQDLENLGLSH